MNVLSLFDGMSCGRIALERAGIEVDNYYSSEIDKYAISIADKNYPQDSKNRLGNICEINTSKLPKIDLLIGGSPCLNFSMAGNKKGSSTKCGIDVVTLEQYFELKDKGFEFEGQSYLFWEYVRIMRDVKPKYFFLENVRITKKWLPMFNKAMGCEPFICNSSLVSAQNRLRYYWTNIPNLTQPEDKEIVLRDILESNVDKSFFPPDSLQNKSDGKMLNSSYKSQANTIHGDKAGTLCAGTHGYANGYVKDLRPCELKEFNDSSTCHHAANATDIKGNESIKRVYADTGKSPTLTTMQGGHRQPKVLIVNE